MRQALLQRGEWALIPLSVIDTASKFRFEKKPLSYDCNHGSLKTGNEKGLPARLIQAHFADVFCRHAFILKRGLLGV